MFCSAHGTPYKVELLSQMTLVHRLSQQRAFQLHWAFYRMEISRHSKDGVPTVKNRDCRDTVDNSSSTKAIEGLTGVAIWKEVVSSYRIEYYTQRLVEQRQ